MNYKKANDKYYYFDNRIQKDDNNRPFRFSGTEIVYNEPSLWYNEKKMFLHKTIHSFIYLDEQGGIFRLKFDQKGNFEHKL